MDAPKKPVVKKLSYVIAEGKSITTKRGIKAGGEVVTVADFAGGENSLKALVKSEHVVKG